MLATAFLKGHRQQVSKNLTNLYLDQPLGNWKDNTYWFQQRWNNFFSPHTNYLYIKRDATNIFDCHKVIQRSRTRTCNSTHRAILFHYQPISQAHSLLADSSPVEEQYCGNYIRLWSTCHQTPCQPNPVLNWIHYIQQLPTWDKTLIEHNIEIKKHQLINLLRQRQSLYLCSDGGANKLIGSYGSAIAINNQLLIGIRGRAFGLKSGSFRAESYGMLALVCYIYHLTIHYSIQLQSTLKIYCDNLGLLKRIYNSQKKTNNSPRQFLFSKIDVEMQIIDTLTIMNTTACKFAHVKGHQDDNIPFKNLSWPAKMNVYCDQLATKELNSISTPSGEVSLLPASRVMLMINNTTITHHIPTQIRRYWSSKAREEYLRNKHKWNYTTFDLVDWETFRSVLAKFSFLKTNFIIKWINKIIPFNLRHFQFEMVSTPMCPSGCQCEETETHFLRCSHKQRRSLYTNFIQQLPKTFNQHNIDPTIRQAILILLNVDSTTVPTHNNKIITLITHQRKLGIDSIYYGLLHETWVEQQSSYLNKMKLPQDRQQAQHGIQQIITEIFIHTHELWLLRNAHLHGIDPNNLQSYKRIQLLHEIKSLYDQQNKMLASDRDIFAFPYSTRQETHTVQQLSTFLKGNKAIFQQSIKDANTFGNRFRKIPQYFPLLNKIKHTATKTQNTQHQDSNTSTHTPPQSPLQSPTRPSSPFIPQDQQFPPAPLRSYENWKQHKYSTQNTQRTHTILLPQLTSRDPPRTFLPWFLRPPDPSP